ncbi:MAG: TetR/AcrR family transcriptional regulator [Xanthobacteraceae bacterium]
MLGAKRRPSFRSHSLSSRSRIAPQAIADLFIVHRSKFARRSIKATRIPIFEICSKICQEFFRPRFPFRLPPHSSDIIIRMRKVRRSNPALPASISKWEANKRDKLRRIKEAARELFLSRGFDDTTTREIARRADVALGTLFTYASNKRDLLFLVGNDALESLAQSAATEIRPDLPLIQNLTAVFRPLYRFFGSHPTLSKLLLREFEFYDSGEQAKRAMTTRLQMIAAATEAVRIAIAKSEIVTTNDPSTIGWVIFSIYQAEIRFWLRDDKRDLARGIARLKRSLLVVVHGANSVPKTAGARAKTTSEPAPRRLARLSNGRGKVR